MSPASGAHDAPARRRRPPAAHKRRAARDRTPDEEPRDEPQDDDPPDDEPDPVVPEDPGDARGQDEADDEPAEDDETGTPSQDDAPPDRDPAPSGDLDAQGAARRAVEHLRDLTHHRPEGVVGIDRDEDGWSVTVEVLEDAHVPSTSDVLAEYEVRLDGDGGLVGVTRGRRYVRGRTER